MEYWECCLPFNNIITGGFTQFTGRLAEVQQIIDQLKGIGGGQTFFRILLIVVLFGAIAIFKLGLDLGSNEEAPVPSGATMESSDGTKTVKPHVVDFKTIHQIKATAVS